MLTELIGIILRVALIATSYRIALPYLFSNNTVLQFEQTKRSIIQDGKKKKKWGRYIVQHFDRLMMFEKNYVPYQSGKKFVFTLLLTLIVSFIAVFVLLYPKGATTTVDNPFLAESIHQVVEINFQFILIIALSITSIPYLFRRQRYSNQSTKSSYDLLEVIKIFSQFERYSTDIALDKTSELLNENNQLRELIRHLGNVFASYSDEEELKKETRYFIKSINTTFAYQFINNLIYAEKYGAKSIRNNIKALYQEMEKQYTSILEIQSEQKDAIQLGTWGGILIFVILIGSFSLMIGFSTYLKLQFYTKTGVTLLTATIITTMLSIFIASIISKPKLDY